MSGEIKITFWGVRGSYPTPGPSTVHYGGNTSCVEITADGETIILDAGTGMIGLGRELAYRHRGKPVEANIFFSHMHHDHSQGFRFFNPIHMPSTEINIFGPEVHECNPEDVLAHTMHPASFPLNFHNLRAQTDSYTLEDGDAVLLQNGEKTILRGASKWAESPESGILVRTMRSDTHPGGVMFYRIESQGRAIVYATDTERTFANDHQLIQFARGADLLIHDAQYTEEHYEGRQLGFPCTRGWGHSTPSMACDVARAAQVKQLALFHYEPGYDDKMIADIERKARTRFANTIAPYEGMTIALAPVEEETIHQHTHAHATVLWSAS